MYFGERNQIIGPDRSNVAKVIIDRSGLLGTRDRKAREVGEESHVAKPDGIDFLGAEDPKAETAFRRRVLRRWITPLTIVHEAGRRLGQGLRKIVAGLALDQMKSGVVEDEIIGGVAVEATVAPRIDALYAKLAGLTEVEPHVGTVLTVFDERQLHGA